LITSHDPFHEIIGEAENGKQAVQMALGLKPNVILMDADMPVMDGAKATRLILNNQPGMPILAISMHRDEDCFGNI
jgi:chemotaxis response regulator CheB